jgi:tetratricopeptide (TPR) repeat protein
MYMELGRLDDAIKLQEQGYRVMRAKMGLVNVGTLNSMYGLASAYNKAGRRKEAIALMEEGLAPWLAKKEKLPGTALYARHNLGAFYVEAGMLDRAIPLLEASVADVTPTLGKQHPLSMQTTRMLAVAYREAGRFKEAIRLFETLHDTSKPADKTVYAGEMAATRERAGNLREALVLWRALVDEMLKVYGADDLHTAAAKAQLGACLNRANRPAEAEPLLRAALALRQKSEPKAWTTFSTQSQLGASLADQKRYSEAEPLLLGGCKGMKEHAAKIPRYDRMYLTQAMERLAQCYEATGKKNEASKWRKEAETTKEEKE